MATEPQFGVTPHIEVSKLTTANTNITTPASGAIVTVFTAGANGSRIHRITAKATDTAVAACFVRLFFYSGSVYSIFKDLQITALGSVSATSETPENILELYGEDAIILPNGWTIVALVTVTELIDITVEGADL